MLQASYEKREIEFKSKIDSLEGQLSDVKQQNTLLHQQLDHVSVMVEPWRAVSVIVWPSLYACLALFQL